MGLQPLTIDALKFLEGKQPRIYIRSWACRSAQFVVRVITREGMEEFKVIPNIDRTETIYTQRISQLPMSMEVSPLVSDLRRGELYVEVGLRFTNFPCLLLAAGYVTEHRHLTWPPGIFEHSVDGAGRLRSITGTDPAAGTQILETVPTNARWKLKTLRILLTTNGTVANRRLIVIIDDGAIEIWRVRTPVDQTASTARNYLYSMGRQKDTAFVTDEIHLPLPDDLVLFQGWRVRTITDNMQAGDNYGPPQLLVEEWIEE